MYMCDSIESHCEFVRALFWQEWTRVWLICELRVSPMLPSFIVDYAARRAMPRATTWLKPQVETASKLWLKNGRMPPSSFSSRQPPNGATNGGSTYGDTGTNGAPNQTS
jgi:hypothetical protein